MASPLEDLDELILRCRNKKARLYISEAVASYRAGAFRSSIVSCWIAVCFDIIEKLRELALAGDKAAEQNLQELDHTRRSGDVSRALKFERTLLTLARDQFELISHIEFIDLDRLQEDRNRCAHPSLTSDDVAYIPSAELARLHLHSAVSHLLQHPPAQGKYALERLMREVESEYFPNTLKEAKVAFESGPLRRPRESLVRNFLLVLVKALVNEKPEYKRRRRLTAAIAAIAQLHHAIFSETLRDGLTRLLRSLDDDSLLSAISFLEDVKNTWQYLDEDVAQRVRNFVRNLPSAHFDQIEFLLTYGPLQAQARARVQAATLKDMEGCFFFTQPKEVADRLITIYLDCASFDAANTCAKTLIWNASDFSADDVRRILTSVDKKPQVRGSYQLEALVEALRQAKQVPNEEFDELLESNGLDEFVKLE